MSLYKKVLAVNRIYKLLEIDAKKFKKKCKIECEFGCGECCINEHIEASILEFIPLAYNLFKNGRAYSEYKRLKENKSKLCQNLQINSSEKKIVTCKEYENRGLICRLFGYSAVSDKNENPVFATCKIIKENFHEQYLQIIENKETLNIIPKNTNYYYQLSSIDVELGSEFYPVNEAILKALEVVLSYYSYRKKPKNAG